MKLLATLALGLFSEALPAGLTRDGFFERAKGHGQGVAGLVGRFAKPTP